jgi:RNA polymerase sigma-70 factor (ECF subfamily)
VVQEVFLAVASGIARFQRDRANSTFRGWLWTIARNEARDHFTRRGKHPCPSGGSGPLAWLHEVPEQYPDAESDSHVSSETTELLQRAVVAIRRDFQERTWQAFWRTTVDGEDTAEVARQLGMTARAVRLAKNRVLRRLRKEFCDLIDLTVIRHERLASTGGDATKPGDPES